MAGWLPVTCGGTEIGKAGRLKAAVSPTPAQKIGRPTFRQPSLLTITQPLVTASTLKFATASNCTCWTTLSRSHLHRFPQRQPSALPERAPTKSYFKKIAIIRMLMSKANQKGQEKKTISTSALFQKTGGVDKKKLRRKVNQKPEHPLATAYSSQSVVQCYVADSDVDRFH